MLVFAFMRSTTKVWRRLRKISGDVCPCVSRFYKLRVILCLPWLFRSPLPTMDLYVPFGNTCKKKRLVWEHVSWGFLGEQRYQIPIFLQLCLCLPLTVRYHLPTLDLEVPFAYFESHLLVSEILNLFLLAKNSNVDKEDFEIAFQKVFTVYFFYVYLSLLKKCTCWIPQNICQINH